MPVEKAITSPPPPSSPTLPWRATSTVVMGMTAVISRAFLYGLNKTETIGLDRFLEILDARKDVQNRERGLITVSNHVSVVDDPLVWGVLPIRYALNPSNHRWSLGSYDICFTNKILSKFFTLGQVLPTHRSQHSSFGGLFQPTITQSIRLLSSPPFPKTYSAVPSSRPSTVSESTPLLADDPFSSGSLTYSTNGTDSFPAPSAYEANRHAWVHIFPEGRIHQHPKKSLRYFKWGISRLILESEPLPDIVPMFIDGNQDIMHESREFPRFLPRIGKNVRVAFGEKVDGEKVFGELRAKWKNLVQLQKEALIKKGALMDMEMGDLTEGLKHSKEAQALREEVTLRIRKEVLKVRASLGLPDEDPKQGLVETWIEEGPKRTGQMDDGSFVGET